MSTISQRTQYPLAIEWYPTEAPERKRPAQEISAPSWRKKIREYLPEVSIQRPLHTPSTSYEIGVVELLSGGIGFINGINNTLEHAKESALRISTYAEGVKVHGIYNATHSVAVDIFKSFVARRYKKRTLCVELLQTQWRHFVDTHGPDSKYLQIGHSAGAIHIYNALEQSPPELRNRVIILAIAPATVIPNTLCHKAHNYVSKQDRVLSLVGSGVHSELTVLDPHPQAPSNDHLFASPTFQGVIKASIATYLMNESTSRSDLVVTC